jgi:hypothetical protein
MFGRKGISQARPAVPQAAPAAPSPVRAVPSASAGDGSIFPREIFEGETGDMLRKLGFAPDDPMNIISKQESVDSLLVEGLEELASAKAAVNAISSYPIGVIHLLPPALWRGRFGPFLLNRLDLSPYRPWNSIFLPLDQAGSDTLFLPVAPQIRDEVPATVDAMMEIIVEIFEGRGGSEAEGTAAAFEAIRANFPSLFPPDRADFSQKVCDARANVRALAFMHAATEVIDPQAIVTSQETFLGDPGNQLIS